MRHAPKTLVLALDIGTSSTRSALFDEKGRALTATAASRAYALRYTADGGAEIAPELLLRANRACVKETMGARDSVAFLRRLPISAVGGSAFWHSLLGLDQKGQPLTPIYTWADSRSAADADRLRAEFDERKIQARTGCMLRASFWPAKLRWLRRSDPRVFHRVARWVSPADWIFEELFQTTGTSYSMASATGLYDLPAGRWDPELCEACAINPERLSVPGDVATPSRTRSPRFADAEILPAIGDGAAGNLGSGVRGTGSIAINIGTSAAVRVTECATDRAARIPFGLFRYAIDRERTVLGGAVSNAGNLHQWCLRELNLKESETKFLCRKAAATDGLTVLPFWVSERAPTWPENLSGTIIGLSQATDAGQILRTTACAVFYRLASILDLIEGAPRQANAIIVSGGILHSPASVRLLADALGRDLCILRQAEASLRGAAIYVLEKLGREITPLPKAKVVRHDRDLAKQHRVRRARQVALETKLAEIIQ